MSLDVDPGIRTGTGAPLPGTELLPQVQGVGEHHDQLPDRIGNAVREHGMQVLLAAAAAGAGTAVLQGGSVLARVGRGAAGVALGGGLALAGAIGLAAIRGARARARDIDRRSADGSAAPSSRAPEHLRVMTLNIREGLGPDRDPRTRAQRFTAMAAMVQREHPDVLLLQEVSVFSPLTGFADNVTELQHYLQPTSLAYGPGGVRAIGTSKGTAVLTFGGAHLEDARNLRLPDVNGEGTWRRLRSLVGTYREWRGVPDGALPDDQLGYHPRNALDTLVVTAGGHRVRALSTHLTGGVHVRGDDRIARSQAAQVAPLAAAIGGGNATSCTTILGGDFNVLSNRPADYLPEVRLLAAAGLHDAFTTFGIPPGDDRRRSFASGSRIDRIYATGDATVNSIRVLDDPVSDHRAVVADVTLA